MTAISLVLVTEVTLSTSSTWSHAAFPAFNVMKGEFHLLTSEELQRERVCGRIFSSLETAHPLDLLSGRARPHLPSLSCSSALSNFLFVKKPVF